MRHTTRFTGKALEDEDFMGDEDEDEEDWEGDEDDEDEDDEENEDGETPAPRGATNAPPSTATGEGPPECKQS